MKLIKGETKVGYRRRSQHLRFQLNVLALNSLESTPKDIWPIKLKKLEIK